LFNDYADKEYIVMELNQKNAEIPTGWMENGQLSGDVASALDHVGIKISSKEIGRTR
jgi:hypothetical protein